MRIMAFLACVLVNMSVSTLLEILVNFVKGVFNFCKESPSVSTLLEILDAAVLGSGARPHRYSVSTLLEILDIRQKSYYRR